MRRKESLAGRELTFRRPPVVRRILRAGERFKFRSGTGARPAFVYVLNLIQPDFTLGRDAHAPRVAAHPRLPAYSTGALRGARRSRATCVRLCACALVYALRGGTAVSARERRSSIAPSRIGRGLEPRPPTLP